MPVVEQGYTSQPKLYELCMWDHVNHAGNLKKVL